MDNNNDKKQVQLNLKPEVATGSYSNLAIISHSPTEFVSDFASSLPGLAGPQITNRIIMSPEHAKRLMHALVDNVSKYENQFGTIHFEGEQPKGTFNLADFPGVGTKS